MATAEFFQDIFAGYWETIDRSQAIEDEQGLFGDPDTFDSIIGLIRPEFIVEIGSWKGHSANHMATTCKALGLATRIVCVDTFAGSVEHWIIPELRNELHLRNGRPTLLERLQGNVIARGNVDTIFPFPVDSACAARVMKNYGVRADLIFLDGAHSYEAVTGDISYYWPLLSHRGMLFGDDYQHEPVARAVVDAARVRNVGVALAGRKWALVARDQAAPAGWTLTQATDALLPV